MSRIQSFIDAGARPHFDNSDALRLRSGRRFVRLSTPGGALTSYAAVPAIGWLQIVSFIIILELGYGATPKGNAPGDVGGPSWIRYSDPEVKKFKLNVRRQLCRRSDAAVARSGNIRSRA